MHSGQIAFGSILDPNAKLKEPVVQGHSPKKICGGRILREVELNLVLFS